MMGPTEATGGAPRLAGVMDARHELQVGFAVLEDLGEVDVNRGTAHRRP